MKIEHIEPRLEWFVAQMRQKLASRKNEAKSDWRGLTAMENFSAIARELDELEEALLEYRMQPRESSRRLQNCINECADVANRAMMLADFLYTTFGRK
jgi:hypothetical protein